MVEKDGIPILQVNIEYVSEEHFKKKNPNNKGVCTSKEKPRAFWGDPRLSSSYAKWGGIQKMKFVELGGERSYIELVFGIGLVTHLYAS